MATASAFLELLKNCPQTSCGEPVGGGAEAGVCPHCGAVYQICPACGATNRQHVEYCRACRERLNAEAWPSYPGLRAGARARSPIKGMGKQFTHVRLNTAVVAAPIALGELILVPAHEGGIVLIDETEGKPFGRVTTGGPIEVTPAINAGFLFVAAGDQLSAFDLLEGIGQKTPEEMRPMWAVQSSGGAISCPLLVSDTAVFFVASAGGRSTLDARSQVDGRPVWQKPLSFDAELLPATLLDDCLVLLTVDGRATVLDPSDGRLLVTMSLGLKVDASVTPFAVGDHVLFADQAGRIFRLSVKGETLAAPHIYDLNARVSCITANDRYIVLGHSAGVTLLDERGDRLWEDTSGEGVSLAPVLAGDSFLTLDDVGNAALYRASRQGTPEDRRKLLTGDVATPPIMTRTKIAAVSSEGMLGLAQCL